LGYDDIGTAAVRLLIHGMAPRSYTTYASGFNKFMHYCADVGLDPLLTEESDVVRYIAWLGLEGRVHADSLQPYLSAINRFLRDHMLEPVAQGLLVSSTRKALKLAQLPLTEVPVRVALPADVVFAILQWACECASSFPSGFSLTTFTQFRCALAVVTTIAFFCRASTGLAALTEDLVVDLGEHHGGIHLYERSVKGRSHERAHRKPLLFIPSSALPELTSLLHVYKTVRSKIFFTVPARFWSLPGEDVSRWSSSLLTQWLQSSCALVNASPPPGLSWTSHSLRKGAASAAAAQGVILPKIRYFGGWSVGSTVLERDYIDPTVLPSAGGHAFFAWLAPPRSLCGPSA
jgi:hypothetical protein